MKEPRGSTGDKQTSSENMGKERNKLNRTKIQDLSGNDDKKEGIERKVTKQKVLYVMQ